MAAILKLLLSVFVEVAVKQLPTFIAAFQKWSARNAAGATLTADQQKIADFTKEAAKDAPPKP